MNGKAAQLERWLEAIRQRSATNALGQVTCKGAHGHDNVMSLGAQCDTCKAVL